MTDMLLSIQWPSVVAASAIFLVLVLVLVALLLVAKRFLVKTGEVSISVNDGSRLIQARTGSTLLQTLGNNDIHLSSACGGKGSCGQCKVQVLSGGGEMLPTEAVHFTRRQMRDHWRLGCQVKVREDMQIAPSAMSPPSSRNSS